VLGTWNRLGALKKCLIAIRQSVGQLSYEIIVVDGGSIDGTLEWLAERPDVITVCQGKLVGACRAYNAGFRLARAPLVVHINDDDIVQGDCLARAYQYMLDHPLVGQAAFAFDLWKPGEYRHDQAFGTIYANKGITWRDAGDQAGWWTELFYTYAGDCELACRVREAGWKTAALKDCQAHDLRIHDELRKVNNPDGANPDSKKFYELRKRVDLSTPHRKKILHIALNYGKDNQPALQRALRSLGQYRQIDWVAAGVGLARKAKEAVEDWQPDLVFMQIQSGGVIDAGTISWIKDQGAAVVNWSGDVRDPIPEFYFEIGPTLDWQLLTNETWVGEFGLRGINAAYLQIGFNQEIFHPWGKSAEVEPVVFLANHYGKVFPMSEARLEMAQYLRQKYDFGVYGAGWPISAHAQLDWRQEARCYRGCKIAIGMNQLELERYTSDRLFRAMGSGAFYLAHHYPGIEKDFGQLVHLDWWHDLDELAVKIDYYLEHDEERQRIARAGSELVHTRHTWLDRMLELRKILGWHEWR
jgi:spore maturation protein CgeB